MPAHGIEDAAAIRRIAGFLSGASIAAARVEADDLAGARPFLPAGTQIYVAAVVGTPPQSVIETAVRLRSAGFEPVPHLPARAFAGTRDLEATLSRLAALAQVRRVLVTAGDHERPAGPYVQARDLIESGLLQRHGIIEIGVAGHPEGHPRIPSAILDRALADNCEAAEQAGLKVHIVTQFGFDPVAIERWALRLRDIGIDHAVRIGLPGPTALCHLMFVAARCGVRVPRPPIAGAAGLDKHRLAHRAPDEIVAPLAAAYSDGRLGRASAHFYAFGGVAATSRWVAAAAQGRITPNRRGGFEITPATSAPSVLDAPRLDRRAVQ